MINHFSHSSTGQCVRVIDEKIRRQNYDNDVPGANKFQVIKRYSLLEDGASLGELNIGNRGRSTLLLGVFCRWS
jgi:hypothetical protein